MQLGRVFISSVFGGMLDLRQSAAEAARLVGLEPVLAEHLVGQRNPVRDILANEIELCDTYVGIFHVRRGTVPKGSDPDPRAITEMELLLARELGLRCLVFLSTADPADRDPELSDFLDAEVTDYRSGVWTRYYEDRAALRREIAAGLASLRPRMVLELAPGSDGLAARLHLHGVAPAWTGERVLGPVPIRLGLGNGSRPILTAFRRGQESRSQLEDDAIRLLGQELGAAALPGRLGEALDEVLGLASSRGRLVTLEVRTADSAALALPWELIGAPRHPLPVRQGLLEVVRRIPGPGDPPDPLHDPAPTIPEAHLEILGFTPAPVEDEAGSALFWEREQEILLKALEGLLGERRGRLLLPDTGEKEDLQRILSEAGRPRVVHIACHGGVEQGAPVLFLEDGDGRRCPLGADELLTWCRAAPGEAPDLSLLVLSACSTAGSFGEPGPDDEATGLAEQLVRGGLPRVLGMQSTVSDAGATAFAERFYGRLADGADLSQALRAGRAELRADHEWAVPTLTTGCDAGPLVALKGSAPLVKHPFEAARGAFDIESVTYLKEGYVGRHDAERRLRRAFDEERMIAVHGLGGIGKSTLAARFLERRMAEGWRVLIVYAGRELAPSTVFEEVIAKLGLARPAGVSPEEAEEILREQLQQELRREPMVLFLDNFEDNQHEDGRLKDPLLGKALLELAILGGESFRLLFTSRHRVSLGPGPLKVRPVDLGELTPSGCRKLRQLPRFRELGKLPEEAWQRALYHFGGHPKALELLEGFLREQPDRARQLLVDMGPAVAAVSEDLRAEVQLRGRALLVDNVLETVPDERRPSFDRLCLLEAPLPSEELEALLSAEGIASPAADLGWLRDHGFLARTVAPSALSGGDAVHRLLASRRQEALAEREGAEVVRAWHLRVAKHLVERPGPLSDLGIAAWHQDAAGDRAGALEFYRRWANILRDGNAYASCVQVAQQGLTLFPPGPDEKERTKAAFLNARIHQALWALGVRSGVDEALASGLALTQGSTSPEARYSEADLRILSGRAMVQRGLLKDAEREFQIAADRLGEDHPRERAIVLGEIARLRAQAGDVARALKLHEEIVQIFEKLGDVQSRAVALSDIARLRAQAGDVARALKLYDEMVQIFEKLDDVQSRAVALGDIARLRAQAGDTAEAIRLQTERLETNRRLGVVDGIAAAQYDLASLNAKQGKTAEALERLSESWDIFCRIGRADGIAIVGQFYGVLLSATDPTRALEILRTSREAFQLLGRTANVNELDELIRKIEHPAPPPPPPRPSLWQRMKGLLGR